jgi:transposase
VTEVSTIGLDLAKNVFQAHGADAAGAPIFRKKLRRAQVLAFFAGQPACRVAMEACPGASHWGCEIAKLGREVKLIAPAYVKPFVKRQTNVDAPCAASRCFSSGARSQVEHISNGIGRRGRGVVPAVSRQAAE